MDIRKELEEDRIALLLIPGMGYNDAVVDVAKKLAEKNTVCYITLNKTYDSLKEIFAKKKINLDNIVFIDAITKTIKSAPDQTDGCYYVSSPASLTELSQLVNKFLKHGFDYVIFDSLTNLLVYQGKAPIMKFMPVLMNSIRESGARAVLYALSVKEQEDLIRESGMLVDRIVEFGREKEGKA